MPPPKVSIITPIFNTEKDIKDCILSVAGQSYKGIEHFIIDGLSTDSSLNIIKKFSEEYPHIRHVSEKDQGIYDAMNKGIDKAKGDWIYFLGSDDRFVNDKVLENIFVGHQKIIENADFVYGNVLWGDTGNVYDGVFDIGKLYRKNICHQAIFVRKDLFKKIGYFDANYPILADWHFNILCFFDPQVKKSYINATVAKYGTRGVSSTRVNQASKERKTFLSTLINKFGFREQLMFKIEAIREKFLKTI